MGDPDDPLARRELEIRRLCRADARFAAVWADYGEVLRMLRRLEVDPGAGPEALRDYRRLRAELAVELADWLDRARARRREDEV